MSFSFLISQSPGEILIFRTYFSLKIDYFELSHNYDVIIEIVATYFGMCGQRRHITIPCYQVHVWGGHFEAHRGYNRPLGKTCYKKGLGKTRV